MVTLLILLDPDETAVLLNGGKAEVSLRGYKLQDLHGKNTSAPLGQVTIAAGQSVTIYTQPG